jgi:hypothetical protein
VRADTYYPTSFDISLSPPSLDVINQFVTLATAAASPIAPPVAILGLTYAFVQWLSTTALENAYVTLPILTYRPILFVIGRPAVHRLLVAYIVDLIRVLRELFDLTLRPDLALTVTWTELREALEAYEQSLSRQRIHKIICSKITRDEQILTADGIGRMVRDLLRE